MSRTTEYFSIVGSVVLLAAWLVQQFMFDELNNRLQQLNAAEAVFYQYRATNQIFVALRDIAGSGKDPVIADTQTRNYEIGLAYLQGAVSAQAYREASARFQAEDAARMSPDAKRLTEANVLSLAVSTDRAALQKKKTVVQIIFWILNILGSLLLIIATVAKASGARRLFRTTAR